VAGTPRESTTCSGTGRATRPQLWEKVNKAVGPEYLWCDILTYQDEDGRRVGLWKRPLGAGARPEAAPPGVVESGGLVPEVARMLSNNGYTPEDLAAQFAAGARWFATQEGGRTVSAGFVFPNFDAVWEIGGLFTEPGWRRQGRARRIVVAALNHLVSRSRVPRYQARSDNLESIRLAQAAGLREFLRLDHLLANQD
jgi:GNAT superfamily N-acetyltransferase